MSPPIKFWIAFVTSFVAALLLSHCALNFFVLGRPPRPPFPNLLRDYVSSYRRGDNDHELFQHGIYGFGARIRKADILLAGSSMMKFGLSAAMIERSLSSAWNRPVRVFNIGVAFGEGSAFVRALLSTYNLKKRVLLFDVYAFTVDKLSDFAETIARESNISAYRQVASNSVDFLFNWVLDPAIPRLHYPLSSDGFITRSLEEVGIRSLAHGDMVDFWRPREGSVFANPAPGTVLPIRPGTAPQLGGVFLPETLMSLTKASGIALFIVQVPNSIVPVGEIEKIAATSGIPFFKILPSDLSSFDRNHLNWRGRLIATSQVIRQLSAISPDIIGEE
jgi:hypothetical protein